MSDGETLRDQAIVQLEIKFDDWTELAVDEIRSAANRIPGGFTSDDIWANVPSVEEPRAMGAAFVRARSLKIIKPTDEWRRSKRPACHARPVRVWVKA